MNRPARANPFDALDVTEVGLRYYVQTFSNVVLALAGPLFSTGNVIVKGMQGSGKSMLLGLLRPDVRIEYHQMGQPFPVKGSQARFMCASVNLTHAGVSAFGHRMSATMTESDESAVPGMFADYLNYLLALDLLESLQRLARNEYAPVAQAIGLDASEKRLNDYASALAADDCWEGGLHGVGGVAILCDALRTRIRTYRRYLNFNLDRVPADVLKTRTEIGRPVACAARLLKRHGVAEPDVHVFATIDQFEEVLYQTDLPSPLAGPFRSLINTALAARSDDVFYRLGTRTVAWDGNLTTYGTTRRLEEDRDYRVIDLDRALRRPEARANWLFPRFVEDVLRKRLATAGFDLEAADSKDPLVAVFGASPTAEALAVRLAGRAPRRAVRPAKQWPEDFRDFLLTLADSSPLEARLAEAWARQRGKGGVVLDQAYLGRPWAQEDRKWWRKERHPQALLQIAGRCGQAPQWSGKDELLTLSSGNLLVFLGIARFIWNEALRSKALSAAPETVTLPIDPGLQALGVLRASEWWLENMVPSTSTNGEARRRFLRIIAKALGEELYKDDAMSNPGAYGFSLDLLELERHKDVEQRLNELTAVGDLFASAHTTKNKSREPRKKWYVIPVVSPALRLPHQHTKEPRYLRVDVVRAWLAEATLLPSEERGGAAPARARAHADQLKLFSG